MRIFLEELEGGKVVLFRIRYDSALDFYTFKLLRGLSIQTIGSDPCAWVGAFYLRQLFCVIETSVSDQLNKMLLDLPAEIIIKILHQCYFHLHLLPELLGSINQTLRRLVLSMPELWQYITYSGHHDLVQMQRYLERSQELTFHLHLDIFFPAYDSASLASLTRLLQPHNQRMHSLRITPQFFHNPLAPSDDAIDGPLEILTAVGQTPFSALEVLELELSSVDYLQRKIFGGSLPMSRLRELSITCGLEITAASEMVGVQILRCDLSRTEYHPFPDLNFLECLPAMKTLDLILPNRPWQWEGQAPPLVALPGITTFQPLLVLPSLTELKLSIPNVHTLRRLECPNLTTFFLKGGSGPDASSNPDILWLFLIKYSTTLEDVHLSWSEALSPLEAQFNPLEAPLYLFPLLQRLTANVREATEFLTTVRGAPSLRCVSLALGERTSINALLAFFDTTSESLESVDVGMHGNGQDTPLVFPKPRFRFPQLKYFVSQCAHGDAVLAATLEAPVLETLVLYGGSKQVSFMIFSLYPLCYTTHLNHSLAPKTPQFPDEWPDPPLTLDNLHTLTLERHSDIVCRLRTPNIANLLLRPFFRYPKIEHLPSSHNLLLQFVRKHSTSLRSMRLFQPVAVLADVATTESQIIFSNLLSATIVCGEALGAVSSAPKLQSLEILPPVTVQHSHQSLSGFCAAETLILPTAELEYIGLSSVFSTLLNITALHIQFDPDLHNLYSSNEAALVLASLTTPSYRGTGDKVFKFPKLRSIRLIYEAVGSKEIDNAARTCTSYDWDHDKNIDKVPSEWALLPPLDFPERNSDWSGSEVSEDGENATGDASSGEAPVEAAVKERAQAMMPTKGGEHATVEGSTSGVEKGMKQTGDKGKGKAEEYEEENEEDAGNYSAEDSEENSVDDDDADSSASAIQRRRRKQWYESRELPDLTDSSYAPSEASEEHPDEDIPFGFYFGVLRTIVLSRKNEPGCVSIEEIQIFRGRGYETGGFYELEGSRRAAWLARHVSNFSIDESR